jgi:hypothetical protein
MPRCPFRSRAANSVFSGMSGRPITFLKPFEIGATISSFGAVIDRHWIRTRSDVSMGVATRSCLPSGNAVVGRYKGRKAQDSGAKFSFDPQGIAFEEKVRKPLARIVSAGRGLARSGPPATIAPSERQRGQRWTPTGASVEQRRRRFRIGEVWRPPAAAAPLKRCRARLAAWGGTGPLRTGPTTTAAIRRRRTRPGSRGGCGRRRRRRLLRR